MAPFRELSKTLGAIIGVTLVAAIIAGIYLGRSAARPVQRLAAGAARVAAGDYGTRSRPAGGLELAELARAFNSMQSGIAERESRLLHVARHDPTTGLAQSRHAEDWLDAASRGSQPDEDSRSSCSSRSRTCRRSPPLSASRSPSSWCGIWPACSIAEGRAEPRGAARYGALRRADHRARARQGRALRRRAAPHARAPLTTAGITLQPPWCWASRSRRAMAARPWKRCAVRTPPRKRPSQNRQRVGILRTRQ